MVKQINKQEIQTFELIDITPSSENMEKFYDLVIPNLGYNFMTALHDIGDNSIDAACSKLTFILAVKDGQLAKVMIADDGSGMSKEILIESFKPASITPHSLSDLGKFGSGGTFGSYTIAKNKTVITKEKDGELLCMESGGNSPSANNAIQRISNDDEQSIFDKYCGTQGTLIILDDLRDFEEDLENPSDLYNIIIKETAAAYRNFIDAGIKVSVALDNGSKSKETLVKSFDPLYHDQKDKLSYSHSETLEWEGSEIKIRYSVLNSDMFDEKDAKDAKAYERQGVYIMRNNRQIMVASNIKGLWRNNPLYNMGRLEISYTAELDDHFRPDAKKSKVIPIHRLIQFLKPNVRGFKNFVASKYDKASASSEQQKKEDQTFAKNLQKHGGVLGIPKIEKINKSANVTPIKSYKTGKSRSTSKSNRQPSRKSINFVYQKNPHGPHVWYEMDNHSDLTIVINEAHKFIQDNYISGTKSTKRLLRKVFAANLLALADLYDTLSYDVVYAHNVTVDQKLKTIHSLI